MARPRVQSKYVTMPQVQTRRSQTVATPFDLLATPPCPEGRKAALTHPAASGAAKQLPRYLRLPEVRQMVPLSPATIWRKTRAGTFPPAIKISERITAWSRESVEAWLAAKEAA